MGNGADASLVTMKFSDEAVSYYAHSTPTVDKSNWQSLRDHLVGVGSLAARNGSFFGGSQLAEIGGLLHDLGKYTREFQLRLSGEFPRMDHATWGARIARERYGALGHLIAYGIAGHHAGLANGRDGVVRSALTDRLSNPAQYDLLPTWKAEVQLPVASGVREPEGFKLAQEQKQFQVAFLGRMLFSCLVDADFRDTEEFYLRVDGKGSQRASSQPSLEQLRERLEQRLSNFRADSEVNLLRAEILDHVRKQADQVPGLFSLTVPTGGGKTLASLAFALDHAIRHGLRRVIFVIPFTSIVEQNAAVFRDAFGDLGDVAVLEHHSAFIDDTSKSPAARDKLRVAMENWDAPVVVTTAVQFFESLFADRPSKCRKLHNISGSVVILDEAQTLPLKLLRPCVAAVGELALNYKSSVVLCTATQPALNESDGFLGGLQNVRELAPQPQRLFQSLKRVAVRHVGRLSDESLAGHVRDRDQVLCIVNNRRHARALFMAIAELPGAYHLTTLMYAKHRSQVLAQIRERLRRGEPCRVVSTSLIEAGVDVDFPCVMRAEAGLDSIAQAAGRCNREGRRSSVDSEVLIFAVDNDEWAPPPELKQFAQVFREVQRHHSDDVLALAAVQRYFKALYWQKGALELDAHNLLGLLRDSRLDSLPFETLAAKFRVIESMQVPVIVPGDEEARAALGELAYKEGCVGIARRLQPYLVQLPRQGYEALYRVGAVQPVAAERYGEQFMQLTNLHLYDERHGLSWDDPAFMKAEGLCW
jgi:CRISPR-associated endonuclease/helicase Cas3